VRLAVFTSKYPAQVATFFERDMRALIEAGMEVDVFSIAPLDPSQWRHSLDLLGPEQLPRERVHHLSHGETLGGALRLLRPHGKGARLRRDTRAILTSAARHGPVPLGKTAYVLPKAWAWAAEYLQSTDAPRYDHVLAYWGNYAATCAYAFHRLAVPRVPFSIWLHAGTDLYRTPVFMREKLLYADNIITCCEFNVGYMTRAFADIAPRFASKVHVCHHGLDIAAFPYRADGRPGNRVLAVGRLARHKGFDYLIRAVHQLTQRGTDAVIEFVGDGQERPNLEALARRLGVADRVHFRGWLPFPEVRRAMSEATVLVHPSDGLGDGLPNVVREAMAVGTPVIASDVAGIPDALQDGCGVLVPPKNVAALADAIGALLQDPAERQRIAARARRRAVEQYDLWRNGARLAAVLRGSQRGGARPALALASAGDVTPPRRYHFVALQLLLEAQRDGGARIHPTELDELDWSELRIAARRGGALVRVADAVTSLAGGEPLPPRFQAAAATACTTAQRVLELVGQLSSRCDRLGVGHAFLRTVESYPDASPTVELLIGHPKAGIDALILDEIPAARRRAFLHHRLAKVTRYTAAYGIRILIRHGRLGRVGEHARFARLLLTRARPVLLGTTTCPAPSRADHLLLLAMQQLYPRPAFRLSDVYGAIDSIRRQHVDWDYLFATALSLGMVPAVGSYLNYVDRMYGIVTRQSLLPADVLTRFEATPDDMKSDSAYLPRLQAAARLYVGHVRSTLESGRWHSAARLSLLPLMALTAGGRPQRGGGSRA
jgi:colanic acid/amylovoran biosynthesis glycosyltransferase